MKILVVTKPDCTECERIKFALHDRDIEFNIENMPDSDTSRQFELRSIARKNRQVSMPIIFVDDEFITTRNFEDEYLK